MLAFQPLQALGLGYLEPAVFGFVEARLPDSMLAAQISRLHPSLVFLQNRDDLLFICLLRFIVWPFLKAKLQICSGSIQGSNVRETNCRFW